MSINRVIISGNLTRDPELRSTASGLPVLGFGVAVNDRRKNLSLIHICKPSFPVRMRAT